ncbi:MAG: DUF2062 domain-containing protein [Proteobacteria bacterium]|nr:DUF2062 domain-containing protein [Pseudomonadota bacterium]
MAKKFFKKYMPSSHKIYENRYLRHFSHLFSTPNLWHLNRYSVATAMSIGLFVGYMPIPGHMIIAAIVALLVQANLPLSIALVWVNNPFTIAPMFIFAYELGAHLLQVPHETFHIELSTYWILHELKRYYEPLLLGCFISGSVLAVLGNIFVRLFWRYHVVSAWRKRAKQRKKQLSGDIHA